MVDFLVIGNVVAAHYDEVFPLIMNERVFFGYSITGGRRKFRVPDEYDFFGHKKSVKEGNKFMHVRGVRWFSSFEVEDRQPLILKKYIDGDYRNFDDVFFINIDKTDDICDYDGVMGVPITFLDRWCRRQFKIIGLKEDGVVEGDHKFTRILIKKK